MKPLLLGVLALVGAAALVAWMQTRGDEAGARERARPANVVVSPPLGMRPVAFVRGANGTIVAAGSTDAEGRQRIALARFLSTGALDRSFGTSGFVRTAIGESVEATSAGAQPDGKIVVVGTARQRRSDGCGESPAVARYLPDGSLDPSFGDEGVVVTTVREACAYAEAVAVQGDGKVVVAGHVFDGATAAGRDLVLRYAADGTLDRTFGDGGIVVDRSSGATEARQLVVQPDGKIVVLAVPGSIVRYGSDGELDWRFGFGGVISTDVRADAMLVTDRNVILGGAAGAPPAGAAGAPAKPRFALEGFTTRGKIDRRFGERGRVLHRWAGDHSASIKQLLELPDGRLLAVGWATRGRSVPDRTYHFVLLRYTRDGTLDRGFGHDGRIVTRTGAQGFAAFQTGRRRLLVVGADDNPTGRLRGRVVFARYVLSR